MAVKDCIITDNAIDLAIERLGNMDESDFQVLFERLSHEQPHVMGFIVGMSEGLGDEEAGEDLLYLTIIIWTATELARNGKIPTLTESDLEVISDRMQGRYEMIMSFPEEDEEDEINALIGGSSQPALLTYLADEFFSEEYLKMSEDKVAKMFACMTVVGETLASA